MSAHSSGREASPVDLTDFEGLDRKMPDLLVSVGKRLPGCGIILLLYPVDERPGTQQHCFGTVAAEDARIALAEVLATFRQQQRPVTLLGAQLTKVLGSLERELPGCGIVLLAYPLAKPTGDRVRCDSNVGADNAAKALTEAARRMDLIAGRAFPSRTTGQQ